jgi:hypothetical protein
MNDDHHTAAHGQNSSLNSQAAQNTLHDLSILEAELHLIFLLRTRAIPAVRLMRAGHA